MKAASTIIGVLAIMMGLLFLGQGLGFIRWPASSFMVDQRIWAWRGAAVAVVGAVLVLRGRRRR